MKSLVQRRAALPMLGWLAAAATPLCAQQVVQSTPGVGPQSSTLPVPELVNSAATEQAQQTSAARPATLVVPRLTLGQTFSVRSGAGAGSESDAITNIKPGLYVSKQAGKVKGFVDYVLTGVAYARAGGSNRLLNQLNSSGSAELVERHAYIDAQASVMQQAINPLGVDSEDVQVSRANRTEVRTVQLTPRVEGRLGDVAQWDARVSHRATHSVAESVSDSSSTQWQLQAGNALQQRAAIGWATQFSHGVQDFSRGRRTVSDVARGLMDWRINPEFSTGVIAGYESTNIASDDMQGRATYGLRLSWVPSERTNLFAETEKRFFGNSHNFTLSHRLVRSVVSYSDTRTLTYGLGQPLIVGRGSVYEFFDQLYASSEPDAGAREAKVLQTLRSNGLSTTDSGASLPAFLSTAVTLQRAQQLSYAWTGVRDTLTVSMQQISGRRVENREVFGDPFTTNFTIRQRGLSILLAHRLTPLSNITLNLTQRRSIGDTDSTRLRSMTAQFTTSLGPRTNFSLLARHADFKSSTQPYTESALVSSLSMTF